MNSPQTKYLWHDGAKRYYIKDPVDGGRVLRNDSRDKIFAWCKQHCNGDYWIGMGFGMFELDSDAALFLLRWS